MQITREQIEKIKDLQAKATQLIAEANIAISLSKANENNKMKWTRKGQEMETTEKQLWDEIYYLGTNTDAYKALKEKYPKTFEVIEKQNDSAGELDEYIQAELGVNYQALKITDIIAIAEAVYDLKNKEA